MKEAKKNSPEEFEDNAQTISEEELDNVAGGGGCSPYGCRECGMAFSTQEEMDHHFEVAHGCKPPKK